MLQPAKEGIYICILNVGYQANIVNRSQVLPINVPVLSQRYMYVIVA